VKICERFEASTTNYCYSDRAFGVNMRGEIAGGSHGACEKRDVPLYELGTEPILSEMPRNGAHCGREMCCKL
jgi:hypothetical protein